MGTLWFTIGLLAAGFLTIFGVILLFEAWERRVDAGRFASGAARMWHFVRIAAIFVAVLRLALASQ